MRKEFGHNIAFKFEDSADEPLGKAGEGLV